MGKYHSKKSSYDSSELNSKEDLLLWIANELAEANRLKRVEILNRNNIPVKHSKFYKELEDQA